MRMKKFFGKIKEWFKRHKPSKRALIQLYSALLYNANIKGFFSGKISTDGSKVMCVPGFNCYSCPGAVGSCPLGSLQNALGSSSTGMIAYVFGILILFGLLLGRTICGFLCPIGLIQDLLYKIKSPKLKKSRVTRILSYFKYVLLLWLVIIVPLMYAGIVVLPAFCQFVCPTGTLAGLMYLANPANGGDIASLAVLFTWKISLFVLIFVGSIFVYRLFCRFLCPLGALYGLFCKIAMLGIKLDKKKCIECGLCIQTCKMDIKRVGDHECINCGACIPVCPTKAISWKGSKLFVYANETDAKEEKEEIKLSEVMESQKLLALKAQESEQDINIEQSAPEIETVSEQTPVVEEQVKTAQTGEKKLNAFVRVWRKLGAKRGLGFQIIAWALALAVLVGALVYFNFIHKEAEADTLYEVGDTVEDFETFQFFKGDNASYQLSDDLAAGKLVVLNFWYISCGGCEAEMPHFGELAQDEAYQDKVSVVIVHSNAEVYGATNEITYDNQQMKVLEKYVLYNKSAEEVVPKWSTFYEDLSWVMDLNGSDSLYLKFGGTGGWPMTAIVDEAGVVRFITFAQVTTEILYEQIDAILAE